MFYGWTKLLKASLPKRLFYRSLLIVAVPIIFFQIIITIVFFDSLWIKTSKRMTRALLSEIVTIIDIYNDESSYNKKIVTDLYNQNFNFSVRFLENEELPDIKVERWFSPMDRILRRELKSRFNAYWFNTVSYKEVVDLRVKFKNGTLQIFFPKERIQASSFRIFALWITMPAILLVFIAIIFLKNQTRPIVNLAKAAEKFGRGERISEFRPSGAMEIRQAGYEFERMRKRITRHLNQRSEMLSGISHDLRTPLTRLKLQIAMINEKDLSSKMTENIDDMEKMLNDYLEFASSQINVKSENFSLNNLVQNIIDKYPNNKIVFKNEVKIEITARYNSVKRCLTNLIDNGLTYGKKVEIILSKTINNIIICIDDDGPGIKTEEHLNVFKPFYRIDKSRSQNKSGVGLGLSIANDIVKSHGGTINLENSPEGGLRVKVSLPS